VAHKKSVTHENNIDFITEGESHLAIESETKNGQSEAHVKEPISNNTINLEMAARQGGKLAQIWE